MPASNTHRPIAPPAERALYDALFCDATPARGVTATAAERLSSHSPIELRRLLDDTGAPSRLRLLAATELRRRGLPMSSRETLGVVVQVAVVMIVRRAGEYAFVRPGREMLYTVVAPEQKYKAKNFNDTVVYRGADAVSGWAKSAVDALASQPAVAMALGAAIALAWSINGAWLARAQKRYDTAETENP